MTIKKMVCNALDRVTSKGILMVTAAVLCLISAAAIADYAGVLS